MEPEVKQDTGVNLTTDESGTLSPYPSTSSESAYLPPASESSYSSASSEQFKQVGEKVSEFLSDLPDYLSDFFGEYKRPLITVGLIIAALIAVKLLLAIIGAINDIPLLAPLFELIGIGYAAWFAYRYLWKAESRRELASDFNSLKEQVLGRLDLDKTP